MEKLNMNYKIMVEYDDGTYETFRALEVAGGELFHSKACKAAIKANDVNDIRELEALVDEVMSDERIRFCPHGRPVMVKLSKRELEKYFNRII
ncbi:MAG: hypothetical protein ACI4KO_09440 [Ruminiclostridium sp.]